MSRGTSHAIDVPWLRIGGTNGGGTWIEAVVDYNVGGPPRTGHITFTGDNGLYLQITFVQAGL